MEVNQSGIFAQREAFEAVLLCSNRASLSRRNRPALPPEEERSSATNEPGRLNTVGTLMLVLLYALYAVDERTCWEEEEEDIAKSISEVKNVDLERQSRFTLICQAAS